MRISDWSADVCASDLSGNDRVLKAMNRSHSRESYLRIIERVRAARPDIVISGDFIVGFPGETEAEFLDTLEIVRAVNYAQAYSFKYSPRPGTPAADMAGQVAAEVMEDRSEEHTSELQSLMSNTYDVFCLKNKKAVTNTVVI